MNSKPSKKTVAAVAIAAASLTLPALALAGPANASAQKFHNKFHIQKVLASNYIGPLQISVRRHTVFVADAFQSTLTRAGHNFVLARGGNPQHGGDLSGVAAVSGARIAITTTKDNSHKVTKFKLFKAGKQVFSYNLANLEANRNPDHSVTYGVPNPSKCVRNALKNAQLPVRYKGAVDSHPYSVAFLGNHRWAVGDAGGNDIVVINDRTRKASVLAVLPRVPLHITKAIQQGFHLPKCARGVTYYTEGVPTDVEAGPNGTLYVSSLPGGPEDPGLPARGRVYSVSPSGHVTKIGDGFAGATNLAVTPSGKVYVAELSKGRISAISHHRPKPVFAMTGVVALEWAAHHLYASSAPAAAGQNGPGMVVRLAANS